MAREVTRGQIAIDEQRRRHQIDRLEEAARDDDAPRGELRMLADVVAERRVKPRDCRDCKNFGQDESGLGFGWCNAHDQYVKLFHPPGGWYSQCLFKGLRRFKPQELERARVPALATAGSLIADEGLDSELAEVR